jgi:hypothetical protein
MSDKQAMQISDKSCALLGVLVSEIAKCRFDVNNPEIFTGYGETMEKLQLPPDALQGQTDGQTLLLYGINGNLPKITAEEAS